MLEQLDHYPRIIFDFDETLFWLHLPWVKEYCEPVFIEMCRRDPSLAAVKYTRFGELENEAVRRLGPDFLAWSKDFGRKFEKEHLRGVEEFHETTDWIRAHHAQHSLYLWTSNTLATVTPILSKAGLLSFFDTLVTSDDVEYIKPDPEGFFHIFDPATQDRNEYVLVGDSVSDEKAAAAAGIAFKRYVGPSKVTTQDAG